MRAVYSYSNVATTPESKVERCIFELAIQRWFPNAYIEQYDVAKSKGGVLIKTTSSKTSSPNVVTYVITFVNHRSNGGNYVMVFG
jgi:hypothetical protein